MYVDASGIRLPFHYFHLIIVSCIHVLNVYNISILVCSVHIIYVLILCIWTETFLKFVWERVACPSDVIPLSADILCVIAIVVPIIIQRGVIINLVWFWLKYYRKLLLHQPTYILKKIKCNISIKLLHVSALGCHPQGVF
jgi:hypothetical protein